VRYSPDGKHFITVGSGKCIIYDGTSGERVKELPVEHKGTITSVSWSPDSDKVVPAVVPTIRPYIVVMSIHGSPFIHVWQ